MGELIRPGVVITINGVSARIQMRRMGACSGHHADCAWNGLMKEIVEEEIKVTAKNLAGAKPGDMVEVAINSNMFRKAIFLVYVLPVLALFAGYLLGSGIASLLNLPNLKNVFAAIVIILGLLLWILIIKRICKNYNADYSITTILGPVLHGCCPKANL